MKFSKFLFFPCLIMALAYPQFPAAQSYPVKTVRLIAPFPTGASQILAYLITDKLTEALGQPVVVDFKPGAGGNIGAELAAKSPADGYTLVILSSGHTTNPSMYKTLKYDTLKDFAPISLLGVSPTVMVVHPSVPAKNLKELVQLARSHPGKLSFGSSGVGASTHLIYELFKSLAKVNIVHIPYKGSGIALTHILGGETEIVVAPAPATIPFINSGKLRGLAVLVPDRVATLPGVPTSAEAGMPELVLRTWYGVAAPVGVRPEIIERLNAAIVRSMQTPEVKQRLAKVGVEAVTNTPGEFSDFLRAEVRKWTRVIKEANIQVE